MTKLFLSVADISVTAGFVVIAVVILRFLLRRAPRWITCGMWGMVGLRLLMPFSVESPLSLIPKNSVDMTEIAAGSESIVHSASSVVSGAPTVTTQSLFSEEPLNILSIISLVWITGAVIFILYGIVSYLVLCLRVRDAVVFKDNIYQSEKVTSPFVKGIFRPRIYIPYNLRPGVRNLVVAHEKVHISRLDHLVKPLGFFLLGVHWFNPLVWIAYVLLSRDIEVACDERVIRKSKLSFRKRYAMALLECTVPHHRFSVCPVAFGEVGVKDRIKNTLNYRNPATCAVVFALVFVICISVGFLTDPISAEAVISMTSPMSGARHIYGDVSSAQVVCTQPSTAVETDPSKNMSTQAATEQSYDEEYVYYEYYEEDTEDYLADLEIEEITLPPFESHVKYRERSYTSVIDGIATFPDTVSSPWDSVNKGLPDINNKNLGTNVSLHYDATPIVIFPD
ncbi:MAG: hypothetical protein IJV88_05725 [Ruminococcus sp.]|nr:hypothetical protein [Ruminococcus sp.]